MAAAASVCHRTPHRLRIKIPSRKRDGRYFAALMSHFGRFQGIDRVETNTLTGTLLFVGKPDVREIAAYGAAKDLFVIKVANPPATALAQKVAADFRHFDTQIRRFTGGDLDLPGLAFLGLVATGIYQISMGNFTAPAWYTAFWYASGIFQKAYAGAAQAEPEPNQRIG